MSGPLTGLRAWLVQRISAVYMLFFLVYAVFSLAAAPVSGWESWRDWVLHPWRSLALLLFFLALLVHAWVGVRDVVLDYLHPAGLRLVVLTLVWLSLLLQALWLMRILFGGSL